MPNRSNKCLRIKLSATDWLSNSGFSFMQNEYIQTL
jgi:hypothetical protein